jgi:hypothetical protein
MTDFLGALGSLLSGAEGAGGERARALEARSTKQVRGGWCGRLAAVDVGIAAPWICRSRKRRSGGGKQRFLDSVKVTVREVLRAASGSETETVVLTEEAPETGG